MRIDAHQHFWKYDPVRDSWITPEMPVLRRDFLPADLEPEMAATGIDASVAVQASQSEEETHFLLDLARQHNTISGVVGWVDLRAPNVFDRLQYFSQFEKLRGFRHIVQAEPDDRFLLSPDFLRGVASLRQFDFTYDILIYPRQLPAAIEMVKQFPEQRFVIDHLAKPLIKAGKIEPWAAHMKAIAANPNVYCKLSGLVTEANWASWRPSDFHPYLDVVFHAFGCDRLLFGSDWPVCLLAAKYQEATKVIADYTKDFSAAENDKIFGSNAIRFYRLAVPQSLNTTMTA